MLATDISKGIVERELMWGLRRGDRTRVKPGPADNSVHDVVNGVSIAMDMSKPVRVGNEMHKGVTWTRSDKSPGSRITGWEMTRKMMKSAHPRKEGPREEPGLFVVAGECDQFERTVISLPRDEKNMDDVPKDAEDHAGDETRYRVRLVGNVARSGRTRGLA